MGDALIDLEIALRSKKAKLTPDEVNFLVSWKSKAFKDFTFGGLSAGVAAWAASSRLGKIARINLSAGAAVVFGLSRFSSSLESCARDILEQDGSQLQAELATIMVTKHQNNARRMQLMSKLFYCEEVFDDSTSERPKIRWRYRNFYSDNIAVGQRTHDSESYGNSQADSDSDSHNDYSYSSDGDSQHTRSDSKDVSNSKRVNINPRQVPVNPGVGEMADPLDYICGYPAPMEEIRLPNTSNVSTKKESRNHRRARRRSRTHHQEDLSNLQHM